MGIISVLRGMRKEKRGTDGCLFLPKRLPFLAVLLLAAILFRPPSPALAGEDGTLSTRDNGSGISRDPATGDRRMRTPQAGPQPEYQGPQTVIVAPEVYPAPRVQPERRLGKGDGRDGYRHPSRGPHPDNRRPDNRRLDRLRR